MAAAAARAAPLRTLAAAAAATARCTQTRVVAQRSFRTTARQADVVAAAPVRKPVGAFRGGIFGFLSGSTLAGAAVYFYILEEYRVSNQLLTEDIYSLQAAVQRIEAYTRGMEERVVRIEKK